MTKFLEMFDPVQKGDFGLTEEAIYKSIQHGDNFIPVWGGSQEHTGEERLVSENGKTKYNDPITIFNGTGIIISLDGSAGSMTFVRNGRFALNHHAGFFEVKKDTEKLIDPQFFALFYEARLKEAGVSEGSKTLSLKKLYSMDFEIPPYDIQQKIMSKVRSLLIARKKIEKIINRVALLKEKALSTDYHTYQAKDIPISEILNCLSGNSGLTEEYLYSRMQDVAERKYRILTASTDPKSSRYIHRCKHPKDSNKMIAVVEERPVIHVVRIGKAGTVTYFDKGNYTITENAYLLYLKDSLKYEVNLKWLMYTLMSTFNEYSNVAEYGTWNKTAFFKNVKIGIPVFDEQSQVVEAYNELENLEKKLVEINSKINQIFTRQITSTFS